MAQASGAHAERPTGGRGGRRTLVVVLVLVVVLLAVCLAVVLIGQRRAASSPAQTDAPLQLEQVQGSYVKPETPVDRSRNVTLPGWGGFTIPANTKDITQGFEFHNPAENLWYEDVVSAGGKELEHLVVDSGTAVELDHYLALAGKGGSVSEVLDYDAQCFSVAQDDSGAWTLEGVAGFDGQRTVRVRTDTGEEVDLSVTCEQQCYYMTFALYLSEGDELLYQSGLVAPGNYVQQMELSRALEPGTYDAYVVCQPYRSDRTTRTNQGVVRITLTAA